MYIFILCAAILQSRDIVLYVTDFENCLLCTNLCLDYSRENLEKSGKTGKRINEK